MKIVIRIQQYTPLRNFRFWDQFCPENMGDKTFRKKPIKIVISIK